MVWNSGVYEKGDRSELFVSVITSLEAPEIVVPPCCTTADHHPDIIKLLDYIAKGGRIKTLAEYERAGWQYVTSSSGNYKVYDVAY